ncbi:hypothetical protein EU78_24240 [Mycolicibacterium rufum]|nr:hypothetical protein EU78_24240 [Mycolicibacterium rufum]
MPRYGNRSGWQRRYGQWLCASDVAVMIVAVGLAEMVRVEPTPDLAVTQGLMSGHAAVSAVAVAGWAALLWVYHSRSPWVIGAGAEEFRRVCAATLSSFGAVAVMSTLLNLDIARGYIAVALPLGVLGLCLNRYLARRFVAVQRRRGRMLTGVLACGAPDSIAALASSFARRPQQGYVVVGACIESGTDFGPIEVAGVGAVPVFGYDGDIRSAVAASGADTIALTSAGRLGPQRIRDLSWQLDDLDVDLLVSPGMVDVTRPRLNVRLIANMPLIQLAKPQYHGAKRFRKRAFDICFALTALIVTSPLLIAVGLAVRLTSNGPALYRSERIGLDGRSFQMIKFRTMAVDADQKLTEIIALNEVDGGVLFKIRQDPRVTPVGRFLRRYSIDELPQFINVLRGEMSVVGPRPPLPREVQTYDNQVRRRLLVRPGITGLWQVSGRSELSWEESVKLDLFYVENWCTLADLVIVLKTVRAVLGGVGAY